MCNSIAWANAKQDAKSVPSFSERIYVSDLGIDAEWRFDASEEGLPESAFTGAGWTVYQYKQRSIIAQDRGTAVSKLKSGITGALKELIDRTGKRPGKYVLFTNLHLTHETGGQKEQIRAAIRDGCSNRPRIAVEIVGAAELAAFLRVLPHVRMAFFGPARVLLWDEAWSRHLREKGLKEVPLLGRDTQLSTIKNWLDDSDARALVIIGPKGIGKTRLTLEATRDRNLVTVSAIGTDALSPIELRSLSRPEAETIVLLETEDADQIEGCIRETLASDHLRIIVSTSSPDNRPTVGLGQDQRIRLLELRPISALESDRLLCAADARIDYSLQSWVVSKCEGNPEMLLRAATVGEDLRNRGDFTTELAQAYERYVRRTLGERAIEALRTLSLMESTSLSREDTAELEACCDFVGVSSNAVLTEIETLQGAGVLTIRDKAAYVTPPLFADHLARSAMLGAGPALRTMWAKLSDQARVRLARRLSQVRGSEAEGFWSHVIDDTEMLRTIGNALKAGELFVLATSIFPDRVASFVDDALSEMSTQERREIDGAERRCLVHVIEDLLFRRVTSRQALVALSRLAEAEVEDFSNNSTGIFSGLFHPLHPQMPLPLEDRAWVLRDCASPASSAERRVLAVAAIDKSVSSLTTGLCESRGPQPFDARPEMLVRDVRGYVECTSSE
jgi:hypothetical protein